MSYSRFFMPLAEESKGYDFKGRTPAGRCIVEERGNTGKLSLWVQDLKPQTKYVIYLIFTDDRKHVGLCMGPLDVDAKGKAEVKRDISELHGFALKKFVAVAVIAPDTAGVVSPLCGYRDAAVPWRHSFQVYTAENNAVVGQGLAPAADTPEEIPATEPETPEADENIPTPEPPVPPPPLPPKPQKPPTPPRAIRPPSANKTRPQPQPTSQNTALLIESIFNANTPANPFPNQTDDIKWVRCTELAQMPLPPDRPHLMTEPFMQAAWADHEHFILGISETGRYAIGIAGTYTQENQQLAKQLGFSQFRGTNHGRPQNGDGGYWLMYTNF